jgi:hypothetical protein
MDSHSIASAFLALTQQEKIETLVRLAHELTIVGRDTYQVGAAGLSQPARLRAINEVQHRVSSHVLALLRNEAARYPDEVLIKIILEHDDDPVLQRQVQQAFDRVLAQLPVSG